LCISWINKRLYKSNLCRLTALEQHSSSLDYLVVYDRCLWNVSWLSCGQKTYSRRPDVLRVVETQYAGDWLITRQSVERV